MKIKGFIVDMDHIMSTTVAYVNKVYMARRRAGLCLGRGWWLKNFRENFLFGQRCECGQTKNSEASPPFPPVVRASGFIMWPSNKPAGWWVD